MKLFFLFLLLVLMSCQDGTRKEERSIEKVSPVEEDMGSDGEKFVQQTGALGLSLSGENLSRKEHQSVAENLKVTETHSQKVIDEFPLFDWGPVSFTTSEHELRVFPIQDVLEINYQLDDKKKVVRSTKCGFKARPDSSKYQVIISSGKSVNPDWEAIIASISQLAYEGDKKAFEFFMKPDAEAEAFLKHSDGAASIDPIVNVLKFMQASGCHW